MFKQLGLSAALLLAFGVAQAGSVYVTNGGAGGVQATIEDSGNFDSAALPGLAYQGVEYLNWGTYSSWYWFHDGSASQIAQFGTNPFGATTVGVGGAAATTFALGGWSFSQTVFAAAPNKLTVHLNLTNNTGAAVSGALWGVGLDPDPDIPFGGGFATLNTVLGQGNAAAVSAVGALGGYSVTLANDTSAAATAITSYINLGNCCVAVDPADAILANQGVGTTNYGDDSISLAYQFGTIADGQTVSIGYSYTFAVPEPEPFALLLGGLGVVMFVARRRSPDADPGAMR